MSEFLEIDHVSKHFSNPNGSASWSARLDSFCVLKDVNLDIARGEFITTIGHSGCGKSTLLNIMAGFEKASGGGVILDGREVSDPGLDRMVVFQSFALMPWLSAFDNIKIAVKAAYPSWDKAHVIEHTKKYIELIPNDPNPYDFRPRRSARAVSLGHRCPIRPGPGRRMGDKTSGGSRNGRPQVGNSCRIRFGA